jgi:TonB family protein
MMVALPLTTANAKWLEKASPKMPYGVYIEGLQGSVVLSMTLDQGGHVTSTRVLKTSGSPVLDQLAQDAAMKWRLSADAVIPSDLTQGRVEKIVFVHAPPHGKQLPPNSQPYWASR